MLRRFEAAAADPALIDDGELNVVICGGGPTGVELAGAFMELFAQVLAKDFPDLDVPALADRAGRDGRPAARHVRAEAAASGPGAR